MTKAVDSEYMRIHRALVKERGKADGYNCVGCPRQAMDWAHRHETNPNDFSNYDPMCRSCHSKYDTRLRGENRPGSKLTEVQVREIKSLRGVYTNVELGQMFGVGRTAISNIHTGKKWSHV